MGKRWRYTRGGQRESICHDSRSFLLYWTSIVSSVQRCGKHQRQHPGGCALWVECKHWVKLNLQWSVLLESVLKKFCQWLWEKTYHFQMTTKLFHLCFHWLKTKVVAEPQSSNCLQDFGFIWWADGFTTVSECFSELLRNYLLQTKKIPRTAVKLRLKYLNVSLWISLSKPI